MQSIDASRQASALYRAHGPAAEVEVAAKIRACDAKGLRQEAEDWRLIQRALRELRH
ncbi:hypothetical protein [Oceanicola sp. S124]|uniref:hypothetical protein n=1 Tax=Oceanicola sp. S124 TaxID=1042378 RepID=UPI0002FF2957|nr:hypothetical protein [Oceanicola sp. S124]